MVETRRLLGEQTIDTALRRQGLTQVVTAHHIGDAEGQFIHNRGQLISDETVGAAQHHIAAALRIVSGNPQAPAGQTLVLPAPAVGDRGGFRAEAVELSGSGRLGPGVGDAAHAGAGEGHAVAVAAVGVGRQIHAVGMQPVHPSVAADDRVIVPRPNPVVAGGRPVQINDGSHRASQVLKPSAQAKGGQASAIRRQGISMKP